jgi:hypothetical protein
MFEMTKVGLLDTIGVENMFGDVEEAINKATELLNESSANED